MIQSETHPKVVAGPPVKKFKRVNGYNLFFSDCVRRNNPEISTGDIIWMRGGGGKGEHERGERGEEWGAWVKGVRREVFLCWGWA